MDALTSFELEAQRRRETVAGDRDLAWARVTASTEPVEPTPLRLTVAREVLSAPHAADNDCQPAPLARQSA